MNKLSTYLLDNLSTRFNITYSGTKFEIDGDLGYHQVLLVFSHDNVSLYLIMILNGTNQRDSRYAFRYSILEKKEYITISGGSYCNPLVIDGSGSFGVLSITNLGLHTIDLSIKSYGH